MNRYKPTKGARFSQKQAQALGETLEKIGFHAQPKQVVDAARPTSSPIHNMFEWNDKLAAEAHRLQLARIYVNHLEIIITTEKGERSTKAFHSVTIDHNAKSLRGYCSLESIVENEDLTEQVVDKALSELNYWRHKYAEYKAYPKLRNVFHAIAKATRAKARRIHKRRRTAAA